MSYVVALSHIVICTKNRQNVIFEEHKRDLYAYIFGIINNHQCKLLRMNGVGNHIHMLIDITSTVTISELVRDIKRSSSRWIIEHESWFPMWDGWGKEYAAFSVGPNSKNRVIEYIKNQEEHHKQHTFMEEYQMLVESTGLTFYPPKME